VITRHGIGTFVSDGPAPVKFQLEPKSIPNVVEVLSMLEFRISLESEAAALGGRTSYRRAASGLAASFRRIPGSPEWRR
jgi:DNA-binding FadR family transcriptional regulator